MKTPWGEMLVIIPSGEDMLARGTPVALTPAPGAAMLLGA